MGGEKKSRGRAFKEELEKVDFCKLRGVAFDNWFKIKEQGN